MKAGRDTRVDRYFWRIETLRHRWSVHLRFWLASDNGNLLRINRQPRFAEIIFGRCVVLCHSRLGR